MPNVGGKKFPYTPAGLTAARDYAVRTGQPMRNSGNSYGNNPVYGGPVINGPARRPSYGQNPGYGRSPIPRQPLRGSRFGGQRQPMGYSARPQSGGRFSGLSRLARLLSRGRR